MAGAGDKIRLLARVAQLHDSPIVKPQILRALGRARVAIGSTGFAVFVRVAVVITASSAAVVVIESGSASRTAIVSIDRFCHCLVGAMSQAAIAF
jgi:hypothetical protein